MTAQPRVDIERLRRSASLVDLLPPDAGARRVGKARWKARCSFHEEKTPSMYVFEEARGWTFHCFGCSEHGDVIDYVMRTRSLSFRDAVGALGGESFRTAAAPPVRRRPLGELVLACDGPGCGATEPIPSREDAVYVGRGSGPWTVLPDGRAFCVKCCDRLYVLPRYVAPKRAA